MIDAPLAIENLGPPHSPVLWCVQASFLHDISTQLENTSNDLGSAACFQSEMNTNYCNKMLVLSGLSYWWVIFSYDEGFLLLQTQNKENGQLAALKKVDIREEDELDDFMVEVDILSECVHQNVVGINETYFYDNHLWVS